MPLRPPVAGGDEDTAGAGDGLTGTMATGGCSGKSIGGTGATGDIVVGSGVDVLGCK